jgi:Stage II sporulation protein E (SpoIIE)
MYLTVHEALFAHEAAGHYSLPPDLLDAHRALKTAQSYAVTFPPEDEAELLAVAVMNAAVMGDKLPSAAKVTKTRAAREEASAQQTALSQAIERLSNRLVNLAAELAPTIIAVHLRPAHDEALAAGRAAVAEIVELGHDPLLVLTSNEVVVREDLRPARMALASAQTRYDAVRAARFRLVDRVDRRDSKGENAWCRNFTDLWPASHMTWGAGTTPPWPTDHDAHWIWLLTGPAELWCPTAEEQDARYLEVHAEGIARVKQARAMGAGGIYVPS